MTSENLPQLILLGLQAVFVFILKDWYSNLKRSIDEVRSTSKAIQDALIELRVEYAQQGGELKTLAALLALSQKSIGELDARTAENAKDVSAAHGLIRELRASVSHATH